MDEASFERSWRPRHSLFQRDWRLFLHGRQGREVEGCVFAWFDYELTVVADQYALATLEGALKTYFCSTQPLRPLLERAVKAGVIPKYLYSGHETARSLAMIRNHWAHGNNGFGTPGMSATTLAMCAEVIRRLYPEAERVG